MRFRKLGNSGFDISVIGFGAWAIGGGDWEYGWGPQDDQDSIKAIHESLDHGINWIDTAAVYGLGRSEEVVARALAEYSGERPYVFTKCALRWNEKREIYGEIKAESVRKELEDSLRRLKIDVIDLYQIHWPNPDDQIEEGWTELAKQQQAGKIRYIGVSNFNVQQLQRAQAIAPVTSLQPPYSLLSRGVESEILPYCLKNDIGTIIYSPMQSGMLTGAMTRERIANFAPDDWRRKSGDYNEPKLTKNLNLVELLREIGNEAGKSPGEVAIAWTLRNPAVTGAIVGLRKPGQINGVIGAGDWNLDDTASSRIEEFLKESSD